MVTSTPRTSIPAFLDAGAVAGLVAAGLVAAAWAFVHFGSGAASQGDAPSGIVGVSSSTSALDSPVDKVDTSEASAGDANNTSAGASDEVENVAPSNVEAQDDAEEKST
ncbi:MAG: hypothetical protein HOM34_04695 [Planctomycetes bacterium]|nr:hypothetical protein [Planctomycetota bacterium]